jgi:hypothetical protein
MAKKTGPKTPESILVTDSISIGEEFRKNPVAVLNRLSRSHNPHLLRLYEYYSELYEEQKAEAKRKIIEARKESHKIKSRRHKPKKSSTGCTEHLELRWAKRI